MFSVTHCNDVVMDLSKHREVIGGRTCFRRAQRASKGCDGHHWIHRASCMPLDQRETFRGLGRPQSANDGLRGVVGCSQQRDIAAVCETSDDFKFRLHVWWIFIHCIHFTQCGTGGNQTLNGQCTSKQNQIWCVVKYLLHMVLSVCAQASD